MRTRKAEDRNGKGDVIENHRHCVGDFILRSSRLVLLSLSFVILVGCGGRHAATVSGTVTLDGKPLDRGTVTLHPTGGGAAAVGPIGSDGVYTIKTGTGSGLAPGEYTATVVANEDPILSTTGGAPMPGVLITPARYGTLETSDLHITVIHGANDLPLELTSSP
jgi:hypothetical protein